MTGNVPTRRFGASRGRAVQLNEALRLVEEERERFSRRRLRHLLIVGVGLSILVHLSLMYYLATVYRFGPPRRTPQPVSYEFAILQEEELTDLQSTELDELIPEIAGELDDLPSDEPAVELDAAIPAAELEIASGGATPTLGGAGDAAGSGGSLTGGAAGTSFFGVSSRGMRFAYVVDRSGSMGQNRKMLIALRELARSIESLPDYASFYVLLFSTDVVPPPMQDGWMRARKNTVNRFIKWLNEIDPGGGTEPMHAFHRVFALQTPPDVVFFLTDGQIPDNTADLVAALNKGGRRVVVNTIAFGDPSSQVLLRRIAKESGGVYRFVPTEGR